MDFTDHCGDLNCSVADAPKDSKVIEMHDHAHDECYLANSVKTIVLTEPIFSET